MANRSDTCRFKNKNANRWWQVTVLMSQALRHSFIHLVTKQNAVVMNRLLITDSPNHSKLQIRSLTKHHCMLLGDSHQMIRISLEPLLFRCKIEQT